jgi:hypothetical protein
MAPVLLAPVLLAAAAGAPGCGSVARHEGPVAAPARPPSLATSLVTGSGTWAVAVLGGSAASHDNFWQLFVRPAGAGRWRLATPPGVASNGGLVLASPGPTTVVAGFRPSQDLANSPLATSHDNGASWSPGILAAGLADVPDALAAAPAGGRLVALLGDGTTELSAPGGTAWTRLATRRKLAASAAGTRCGLGPLTAVAFSPPGTPLAAAACTRPGLAGIFAYARGAWHLAGPVLPAQYGRRSVTVLRLTTTAGATMTLLMAGTGTAARLLTAWSTDGGARWALSRPLPVAGATVRSAAFGPAHTAAVVLTGNRAETSTGTAGAWRPLPALPPGTATLAAAAAGTWSALAVHGTRLTVWRLAAGGRAWARTQTIAVPVQFGSSG